MPCKDSSALAEIRLDPEDRVLDFDYSKITCGRPIGSRLRTFCAGRAALSLIETEWEDILDRMEPEGEDDEFLLFLEWSALIAGLQQYLGLELDAETAARCQIAEIEHDGGQILLRQVVRPMSAMPPIESCRSRHKREEG